MDNLLEEFTRGLDSAHRLTQVLIRMIGAAVLGAMVGIEREHAGKPAGLRTHILVSLGTAIVVLACSGTGMDQDGLSRVIQGIVTGIGFIGAGSILKLSEQRHIEGLTTAAGLWMTAAIGVAAGLGSLGVAAISAVLTVSVLAFEGWLVTRAKAREKNNPAE